MLPHGIQETNFCFIFLFFNEPFAIFEKSKGNACGKFVCPSPRGIADPSRLSPLYSLARISQCSPWIVFILSRGRVASHPGPRSPSITLLCRFRSAAAKRSLCARGAAPGPDNSGAGADSQRRALSPQAPAAEGAGWTEGPALLREAPLPLVMDGGQLGGFQRLGKCALLSVKSLSAKKRTLLASE